MIIKCLYCNKEISVTKKNRKFCSHSCFGASRKSGKKIKCKICGKKIYVKHCQLGKKLYCSQECEYMSLRVRKEIQCKKCGKTFYPPKNDSQFCSKECFYNSCLKKGYKEISITALSEEELKIVKPMFNNRRSINIHRVIMALHLGRPLEHQEIVHHLNGNKQDNRIENLELLTNKAHHHTAFGDVYYQKWQEAESKIKELETELNKLKSKDMKCIQQ